MLLQRALNLPTTTGSLPPIQVSSSEFLQISHVNVNSADARLPHFNLLVLELTHRKFLQGEPIVDLRLSEQPFAPSQHVLVLPHQPNVLVVLAENAGLAHASAVVVLQRFHHLIEVLFISSAFFLHFCVFLLQFQVLLCPVLHFVFLSHRH